MEKEYFVTCRETCPECKGEGTIMDPTGLWAKFQKEFVEPWDKANPEDTTWGGAKYKASHKWWESQGYGSEGAEEEYICEACEGEGVFVHEVVFAEALAETMKPVEKEV